MLTLVEARLVLVWFLSWLLVYSLDPQKFISYVFECCPEKIVYAIVLDPMLVHLLHVVRFHIFGPLGLPLPGVLDASA